jgi:hypothetical protein
MRNQVSCHFNIVTSLAHHVLMGVGGNLNERHVPSLQPRRVHVCLSVLYPFYSVFGWSMRTLFLLFAIVTGALFLPTTLLWFINPAYNKSEKAVAEDDAAAAAMPRIRDGEDMEYHPPYPLHPGRPLELLFCPCLCALCVALCASLSLTCTHAHILHPHAP